MCYNVIRLTVSLICLGWGLLFRLGIFHCIKLHASEVFGKNAIISLYQHVLQYFLSILLHTSWTSGKHLLLRLNLLYYFFIISAELCYVCLLHTMCSSLRCFSVNAFICLKYLRRITILLQFDKTFEWFAFLYYNACISNNWNKFYYFALRKPYCTILDFY